VILQRGDVEPLTIQLKNAAPVATGNLRDNGIAGIQAVPKGYIIQIGYPGTASGAEPTQNYALFTEVKNKSSKGWVKRVLKAWARTIEPILNLRKEDSVDAGDEL
jgi:hypothetical protein